MSLTGITSIPLAWTFSSFHRLYLMMHSEKPANVVQAFIEEINNIIYRNTQLFPDQLRRVAGDWAVAGSSGIVFIPHVEAERVLRLAERIVAREAAMLEAVIGSSPLLEVMHDSKFPTADD